MPNILNTHKFLLLASIFVLAGCGQKGPLFLPGDPSKIRTEVPAQDTQVEGESDAMSEEDEDEDERPE